MLFRMLQQTRYAREPSTLLLTTSRLAMITMSCTCVRYTCKNNASYTHATPPQSAPPPTPATTGNTSTCTSHETQPCDKVCEWASMIMKRGTSADLQNLHIPHPESASAHCTTHTTNSKSPPRSVSSPVCVRASGGNLEGKRKSYRNHSCGEPATSENACSDSSEALRRIRINWQCPFPESDEIVADVL